MDSAPTDDQIADAVERMGAHLLRAVSATPRNAKVVQLAFTLPGVGGRGRGMNPSVVGTLLATWTEQIVLVGADAHPVPDEHAHRLIAAARAGFSVLQPLVIDTVRTLNGSTQRALLIAMAQHLAGHVLPLLGGLDTVQEAIAWLDDGPYPPPTPRERVNGATVSVMVTAFAAGNHDLGEHILTMTAVNPAGGDVLASMYGWLVRVAVAVLNAAHDHHPPTDPNDPRLPDPTTDPALPDAPDGAYAAARRSITVITSRLPMAVQREHARTTANMDIPSLAAAVRYVAVTVARNLRAATQHSVQEAAAMLDPDTDAS